MSEGSAMPAKSSSFDARPVPQAIKATSNRQKDKAVKDNKLPPEVRYVFCQML